jgi:hypothetical protein
VTKPREIRPGTAYPSQHDCEREGDVVDFAGQRVGTGPCVDRDGRPVAHTAYVFPSGRNRVLWLSTAGALLLTFGLVFLFFAGTPARPGASRFALRTALAPGPTSAPHSMASTDCVQCHQPSKNVEDARCERCHDPAISARLSNAAHVFASNGDIQAALSTQTVACATCHLEHRGADLNLKDVDDRECGTCHRAAPNSRTRLTNLDRHPEFAVIRTGIEPTGGLKWFNHSQHIDKVQRKYKKTCDGCHERAPNSFDYQPISFDRHCAACHNADLSQSAGSLSPAVLAALGPLRPGLSAQEDIDDPKLKVVTGITHADPWVLRSVQSLRRTVSPAAFAAERIAIDREVAQLELEQMFSEEQAVGAWLSADHVDRLKTAAGAAAIPPDAALRELAAALEKATGMSGPEFDALRAEAARLKSTSTTPQPASAGGGPSVEAIRSLIEATISRAKAAGDADLQTRAERLLERVKKVGPGRTPTVADASDAGLEILLSEIAKIRDPASREELTEMMDLVRLSRRKGAGAMDPTAFDQHRQQTLALLDEIRVALAPAARDGDPEASALLAREDNLRRLVLASSYSMTPETAAALREFFSVRQIARTRIDLELQGAQLRVGGASEGAPARARSIRRLARLRDRLAALGTAQPLPAPVSAADAAAAVAALLGKPGTDPETNAQRKNRCTMCHELSAQGDQLAPLRAVGESLLPRARFTHKNHVFASADNCETCHTKIRSSSIASDVNLPNLASCRTCHAPGRQAARASGCETCHTYHVPSMRALRSRT